MRAPVLFEPRTPLKVLEVELLPPRSGEVMVGMVASGVCHTCLHVMDGSLGGMRMPTVLGDEGAGVVKAVGPDVTSVVVGDHVIISWAPACGRCRQCANARPALCERRPPQGRLADGTVRMRYGDQDVYHFGPATYASEMVLPESCVVPIRGDMPLEPAALIGCSVATGVGAVVNTAKVPAGASVIVFGAGGIGLNVIQGARLAGAYPIVAVDVLRPKLEQARAFGATHVVDASTENVSQAVEAACRGGIEFAFVTIGRGDVIAQAWSSLAPAGMCVILGRLPSGESLTIDPERLYGRENKLVGSRYGSSRPFDDFPRLVELYLGGKLLLDELITRRYELDEINEAHRALAAGELARGLLVYGR